MYAYVWRLGTNQMLRMHIFRGLSVLKRYVYNNMGNAYEVEVAKRYIYNGLRPGRSQNVMHVIIS